MEDRFVQLVDAMRHLRPRKGSFGANVLTLMSGTAAGQGLTLAAAPLLTRLYGPEDFGTLAVFMSICAVLGVIGSWRYEWAIPLPDSEETAANLLVLTGAILLGMTVLLEVGLLLLGDRVVAGANAPGLKPYLWLIPVSLLGAGTYQILTQWALRRKAFGALARTKFTQSLGRAVTAVALGLWHCQPVGLLLGEVVGRASGSGALATLAWRRDRVAWGRVSRAGIRQAARRYRRFPLFSGPSTVLNTLTPQVPVFMLSAYYGSQVVGWYSLGLMVMAMPLDLVIMSGAQVFRAEAARLMQTDQGALPGFMLGTTRRFLWGVIPIGLIGWASPWFMPWIFGSSWAEAGYCTRALTLMFMAQLVVTPVCHPDIYELQHWDLLWNASRFLLSFLCFYMGYYFQILPNDAIMFYSIIMFIMYMLRYFVTYFLIMRY